VSFSEFRFFAVAAPRMLSFMVTIHAEVFDSNSDIQTETDPDDDDRRGYLVPVP
jgi:hypothetical protein